MAADQPEAREIVALLAGQGRSINWLAKRAGFPRQTVHTWLVGDRRPSNPAVWFTLRSALTPENPLSLPMQPYSPGSVMLRYAGEVPAGEWGDPLASEELHEAPSRYDPVKHFVCRVVGTSCWPTLRPQDVTIWRKDFAPAFQSIVIAQRKGDHACTVKALEWDAGAARSRLVPLNPEHGDVDDCDGWGVIGALVYVFRVVDGVEWIRGVVNPGRDNLRVKDLE